MRILAIQWPTLLATQPAGEDPPTTIPLNGRFHWTLGEERRCIGRIEDGQHVPCPRNRPVTMHAQCIDCGGLEDPECVFEPKCQADPAACTCPFGPIPHVVYAAFYGKLGKVGMTQKWRIETRLKEQGADAWFIIQECPDRATARRTERQIATLHRIPEYRSHKQTLPLLARPIDWTLIEEAAEALRQRLGTRYHVEQTLHRINDHPLPQPLDGTPHRQPPHGEHQGTWIGVKGNHLFYRQTASPGRLDVGVRPIAAIKRTDLIGRELIIHTE